MSASQESSELCTRESAVGNWGATLEGWVVKGAVLLSGSALVLAGCAGISPRQEAWTLPSARMPGLTVVCVGEREVTAEECLAMGERHAIGPTGVRADWIEIYTRPPGERCLFSLEDADGRLLLSSSGPCER